MKKKIKDFVQSELFDEEIVDFETNTDLLKGGLVDSIGILSLIQYLETEFGISIPPADMVIENFQSLDSIEQYIERRLA